MCRNKLTTCVAISSAAMSRDADVEVSNKWQAYLLHTADISNFSTDTPW